MSFNEKYQYSGSNSPCPICKRTKDNDCRWNKEVVFCHSFVEQDAGVRGYIYRGFKEIWGLYFPVDKKTSKPIRDKARKEFIYRDINQEFLVKVVRVDDGKGKKHFSQLHWSGTAWVKGLTPEVKSKLRLYRIYDVVPQKAIANKEPLLIVEGEAKVDLLLSKGIAATCSIGGAGKWRQYGYPNYLEDLDGAKVVLCPDRDIPGIKHCLDIEQNFANVQWLYPFPESPEWQNLPKNQGLDIADWILGENLTSEQILAAISPKRSIPLDAKNQQKSQENKKPTIVKQLLSIAEQGKYFHTPNQTSFVDLYIKGSRNTFPLRSQIFKTWLMRQLYLDCQTAASSESFNQVLGVLEGKACFDGPEIETYLRVAEYEGKIYLDLGTPDWTAVEIDEFGWKVVTDYPVRFRRPTMLQSLPYPELEGDIADLKELLNIGQDDWLLVLTWLLFSLYPKHPHPILFLSGEQGSGKSCIARILRRLIDPSSPSLIPNVADLRNLAIAAENRWILAYDNLSYLNPEQSDALCRISTGGGFAVRTLYTDCEETVFEFIRPQILTSIDSLAGRGDLLDRTLLVRLPPIPDERRITEADLTEKLTNQHGRILGALLTCLSQTLKNLPGVKVDKLPRMADFVRFAIASEESLGFPPGSFLRAYSTNRKENHETLIESSALAIAIQQFMTIHQQWQGTISELLSHLETSASEKALRGKSWPKSPSGLGKALNRLAPNLRGIGIEVTYPPRTSNRRTVCLKKVVATNTVPLSQKEQVDSALSNDSNTLSSAEQSKHSNQPVINEIFIQQCLQGYDDSCDNYDTSIDISSWVGKSVKKRGKLGWRGVVEDIQGQSVKVLWVGDREASWESLSDLEIAQ